MSPLGGRPWDEWIARYGQSHEHPVNRVCHTIGIPLIVLSLALFLAALVVPGLWRWALGLFVAGWSFQFIGHAFERHKSLFGQSVWVGGRSEHSRGLHFFRREFHRGLSATHARNISNMRNRHRVLFHGRREIFFFHGQPRRCRRICFDPFGSL